MCKSNHAAREQRIKNQHTPSNWSGNNTFSSVSLRNVVSSRLAGGSASSADDASLLAVGAVEPADLLAIILALNVAKLNVKFIYVKIISTRAVHFNPTKSTDDMKLVSYQAYVLVGQTNNIQHKIKKNCFKIRVLVQAQLSPFAASVFC